MAETKKRRKTLRVFEAFAQVSAVGSRSQTRDMIGSADFITVSP